MTLKQTSHFICNISEECRSDGARAGWPQALDNGEQSGGRGRDSDHGEQRPVAVQRSGLGRQPVQLLPPVEGDGTDEAGGGF